MEATEKEQTLTELSRCIDTLLFRINRLKRKGISKSKRVRGIRMRKHLSLAIQVKAASFQYDIVRSQPIYKATDL